MTDQQHKDMLRLQATLEFLTVNVVTKISAMAKPDGKAPEDTPSKVQKSIETIYNAMCEQRGLSPASEKKS